MLILGLVVILILADIAFFVSDKYIFSFFFLLAILGISYFFIPEVSAFVAERGWSSIFTQLLPMYLAAGVGVALVKWVLYVLKKANYIKEMKAKFALNGGDQSATRFVEWWNNQFGTRHISRCEDGGWGYVIDKLTPSAKENIDRITFWVLQWPIVIVATILEDILIKLGKRVAELFDYLFNGVAKKIIGNALGM